MLRTYKPLNNHPIFKYQTYLQHLVCDVWCNASEQQSCQSLLSDDFEIIYLAREWVKESVDEVYELCKPLLDIERAKIREAFFINNDIESLCESRVQPIDLKNLPPVVASKMKPLLVKFYNDLISAREKLDYYNKLIEKNENYKTCPCCGLTPIENAESPYREDNDHYLPKADYPFAVVNFNNLPPLCSKCNKKCKSTKNPFENGRTSFFPFKLLEKEFDINIAIRNAIVVNGDFIIKEEDVTIAFDNDPNKVATWDWLFKIKYRYNEEVRKLSKTELRTLANRMKRHIERKQGMSFTQILTDTIEDYQIDYYDDRKFLKAPFLKEVLKNTNWINVYL